MRQCICQICVCGKHHCEHKTNRTPYAKDNDEIKISEHRDRYKYSNYQPREQPIVPPEEGNWQGDEPPVTLSTTKKDYAALPFQKPRGPIRPQSHSQAKGKMESGTTYKHDFIPREAPEKMEFKKMPDNRDVMPGTKDVRMEGDTTYGRSFVPKVTMPREPAKAQGCTLTELGKPFLGETETRRCYPAKQVDPRDPACAPKGNLEIGGAFDDTTTHRQEFTAKHQPRQAPYKAISRWKQPGGKFEGETTHAHDFRVRGLPQKTEQKVPKGEIQGFEGFFDGTTNYKRDFMPHRVEQRLLPAWHPSFRQRDQSNAPMSQETTYRAVFEAPPEDLAPNKIKAAPNNLTIPNTPMETLTTNMRDFVITCRPEMVKSCRPDTTYKKPEDKFGGLTVTRLDFTPKSIVRPDGRKPPDNLCTEGGRMEDLTTFMKDFQGMYLDCPAKYLKLYGKEALPEFKFEQTVKGHDYFKLKRAKQKKSKK